MTLHDLTVGMPAPRPLTLAGTALFLDLDGTLAPIAARPQDVRPDRRRTRLLARLGERLQGRLAVVSGRTLADVDRILDGAVRAVAAVHGLVVRGPDGVVETHAAHPQLDRAAEALRAFADRDAGLIVEEKGLSVCLHYRLAAGQAEAACARARDLAAQTGLWLLNGDMVQELRTPGPTKGDSLRAFLRRPPFAGARPVFVGDDLTDEDGFAAAGAADGVGVLVGPARTSAARFRLPGVEAALDWLEAAR
jgi:trehalose 6-phosphate phosphatase